MRPIDADEVRKHAFEVYQANGVALEPYVVVPLGAIDNAPTCECKTCKHRDPEDKKCDCGGLERQGCYFPVSDDYFCKFYEKGSVKNEK